MLTIKNLLYFAFEVTLRGIFLETELLVKKSLGQTKNWGLTFFLGSKKTMINIKFYVKKWVNYHLCQKCVFVPHREAVLPKKKKETRPKRALDTIVMTIIFWNIFWHRWMFWDIFGRLGTCRDVLGHFETLLDIFGYFGTFWSVLGRFGTCWDVLGRYGTFWII